MKKFYKKTIIVAAVAVAAGYNAYMANASKHSMTELMLMNMEALASGESTYTGMIYLSGEYGTGGCINCPEPKDTNCTCK